MAQRLASWDDMIESETLDNSAPLWRAIRVFEAFNSTFGSYTRYSRFRPPAQGA